MARAATAKCFLHVLNVLYIILGLALAATSLWFFVEVYQVTSLRNANHYLLDYNVYWPQVVPWIFFVVGIFAASVSCCGFVGVKKGSKKVLTIYAVFQGIVIVLLLAAAVIALIFADTQLTENFVKDTIWDVYFQSKEDVSVEAAFGNLEKKLQCCGVDSPRDYKNWKNEFPRSCCDVYYHGFYGSYIIDCEFTNKLANERYGCATVAAQYARIVTKVLASVSIFIAFLGIISLAIAISLSRSLKQRPRVMLAQHNESESKKVLL